jgi:ribonuclease PH
MTLIGERTIHIDCDVLQADGGTRTASVTGAMIALADACDWLQKQGMISKSPLLSLVTAVSVGIVDGHPVCDLTYDEDSRADVDMNIVMADAQRFVEVQGTAEKAPYSRDELEHMLALGQNALAQMNAIIRATVPLSI